MTSSSPRAVVVLRPEPGNAQTAARLEAIGLEAVRLPLFQIIALDWTPPAPDRFDALLLTSANTLRHGGAGLDAVKPLPVVAVGATTATAARAAGFAVAHVGSDDAALAARDSGFERLLHLGGRDRASPPRTALAIAVYASEALRMPDLAAVAGAVALLHSARSAHAFAAAGLPRGTIRIAAISPTVADAVGSGWERIDIAAHPTDAALVEIAHALAIDP